MSLNSEGEEKKFRQGTHITLVHPGVRKHLGTIKKYTDIKNYRKETTEINEIVVFVNITSISKVQPYKSRVAMNSGHLFRRLKSTL